MIIDHIRNVERYFMLGEGFQLAFEYLSAYVVGSTQGSQDVSLIQDDVFVKIRPYMTKPISACAYETHQLYADIHYVAQGRERIGWADTVNLVPNTYDKDKDIEFLTGEGQLITLDTGYFMVTFPQDAHMPCVQLNEPELCVKLIAKVRL